VYMGRTDFSDKRFVDALTDALRDRASTDPEGRVNLSEFLRRVQGWQVGTLRKQVLGERSLQPAAIEAIAQTLGVAPEYFLEYRHQQIEQAMEKHTELVDLVYDLLVERSKSLDSIAVPFVTSVVDLLVEGTDLESATVSRVLELVINGQVGDVQAAAFLTALRAKGETADEVVGLARTLFKYGTPVELSPDPPAMDIVSTGGDKLSAFNISTTAAFVAAGAGVRIAKHGNRGQTSRAGAADLLQELGARIDLSPENIAKCVDDVGFGFMFAPLHYQAFRGMVPLRRSVGIRTVFNCLGPIINPAHVKRQLTGTCEAKYVPIMAEALMRLGSERVMVVHGYDGLDEISVCAETLAVEVRDGVCGAPFSISPEELGVRRWPVRDLMGGDVRANATITSQVLAGLPGAALDVVLVNAGAAIYLAGMADTVREGVETARESVSSGRAWDKLTAFVQFTRELGRLPQAPEAEETEPLVTSAAPARQGGGRGVGAAYLP
jgi:anthranilate phosphoribosyltransferase